MKLEVVPTGVHALDEILPGGFLKGGVYVIHGAPGTGKTVLANQVCFNYVKAQGRALYISLLAESHSRMLQHLRSMAYYDDEAMPRLYFVSATSVLASDGLRGLVDLIRREMKRHGAGVLTIDGFSATRESAGSQQEFQRFVHEIQSHAAALECTVLLLTTGADPMTDPAATMVDGIIELSHRLVGRRTDRTLQVTKFRGRSFLPGAHSLRITDAGFVVYPRIEAQSAFAALADAPELTRCSTGVHGIDAMLCGGLLAATTNGLYGPTGIGKTTFGLQFVSLSNASAPGLFFGFFESPARLRARADAMKLDLRKLEKLGYVEIVWRPQGEQNLDALGHEIVDAVARRKVKRVFIDGYAGFLESAIEPERLTRFISSLANELRALGATTVVSIESRDILGSTMDLPSKGLSSLLEGLILMRYVEARAEVRRLISIAKIRDSDFDPSIHEFKIRAGRLEVGPRFEHFEALLSGFGHQPPDAERMGSRFDDSGAT